MEPQMALHLKGTFPPHATDRVSGAVNTHELYPRDEQEKHIVPRLFHVQRALSIQKIWTSLLSILAVALLLVSCFRAARLEILSANAGRRLASGGSENDEDAERSAILEMCLDMQEEAGINAQSSTPLPSISEALPLILRNLAEQSPGSVTLSGGPLQSAPLELTGATPPSQPGPSSVGTAGWEVEGMQAGDGAVPQAVSSPPWYPSAASSAAPLPAPLHHSVQVVPPVSFLLWEASQTSSAPSQPQEQAGVFVDPSAGPSSSSAVRSGISGARPHAEMAVPLLRSPFPAAEPRVPGASHAALGRKRGVSEPATSELARNPTPTGQPEPKKHAFGWKGWRPSAAAPAPSLLAEEQPQKTAPGPSEDESFLEALGTVPGRWSPGTLNTRDLAGDEPQRSKQKEGEQDQQLRAREVASEHAYVRQLELPHSAASPSAASPLLGAEKRRFPLAYEGAPVPSASQGSSGPLTAPVKGPLLGQSGEASSTMPLVPEGDGDCVQPGLQSLLSGPAPRMPLNTHLYYRLPILQPGRITRSFSSEQAFAECNRQRRVFSQLLTMRFLLTRPEITPKEAEALVAHSEDVVGRIYFDLILPVDGRLPANAVKHLGRLYMYLDTIICIIQVVGPSMNASEWWPRIRRAFPSHMAYTTKYKTRPDTRAHAALATRLSSALQVLKGGVRLGEQETIAIKRKLLFGKYVVEEFRDKRWDPWRKDDEKSRAPAVPD